jgi:hypothetical protein
VLRVAPVELVAIDVVLPKDCRHVGPRAGADLFSANEDDVRAAHPAHLLGTEADPRAFGRFVALCRGEDAGDASFQEVDTEGAYGVRELAGER